MTSPECARHADAVHQDAAARAEVRIGSVIELLTPGSEAWRPFTVTRLTEEREGPVAYLEPETEGARWRLDWQPCGALGYWAELVTATGGSGALVRGFRVVALQEALL